MSESSTATITTIQDLLMFNGSARPVMVAIVQSELEKAAAAPDLYAALERALNFIANTESEMGETLPCGDDARAALAKARGEA